MTKLENIKIGESCIIKNINLEKKIVRHLNNLGFTKDTLIKYVLENPLKYPKAYLLKGSIIAIDEVIVKNILVERI